MALTPRGQLVERLHESGYFDDVSPLALDSVYDLILHYDPEELAEEPLFDPRTRRVAMVDAEDLSEGLADQITRDLMPFLRERGVQLQTVSLTRTGDNFTLAVDGQSYLLGRSRDWHGVAIKYIGLLSKLLADAGSSDRAYLVYLGHESRVLFLTPAMYAVMRASPAIHPTFQPTSLEDAPNLRISFGRRLRLIWWFIRAIMRR